MGNSIHRSQNTRNIPSTTNQSSANNRLATNSQRRPSLNVIPIGPQWHYYRTQLHQVSQNCFYFLSKVCLKLNL